jgi:hypothetical protein
VSTGAHEHEEKNDRTAAERLLTKIRTFVAEQLDDDEAALFAALVAPAVAQAYQLDDASGVGSDVDWRPNALPESLAAAVRDGGVRVEGLVEE